MASYLLKAVHFERHTLQNYLGKVILIKGPGIQVKKAVPPKSKRSHMFMAGGIGTQKIQKLRAAKDGYTDL